MQKLVTEVVMKCKFGHFIGIGFRSLLASLNRIKEKGDKP